MAGAEQLGDDGGADPAGRAGDENAHGRPPKSTVVPTPGRSMSVAVITLAVMSVRCHHLGSAPWAGGSPDARGRLEQAALELYLERGFEQTTVAEIAARAGLTERTFFRHFADKREVLFAGAGDAAGAAGGHRRRDPDVARADRGRRGRPRGGGRRCSRSAATTRARQAVIAANADLQERELIKLASLAAAMADACAPAASPSRRRAWPPRPDRGIQDRVRALAGRSRPPGADRGSCANRWPSSRP